MAHPNCHFFTVRKTMQVVTTLLGHGHSASHVMAAVKGPL